MGLGQIKALANQRNPHSAVTTNVCHMSGTARRHSVIPFPPFYF